MGRRIISLFKKMTVKVQILILLPMLYLTSGGSLKLMGPVGQ